MRAIACRRDQGGEYESTNPTLLYDVEVGDTHFQTPQHGAAEGYEFEALVATSPRIILQVGSSDGGSPNGGSRSHLIALSATHLHHFTRLVVSTDGLGASDDEGDDEGG